jgi:transcription elongation GreA/GreB family factor
VKTKVKHARRKVTQEQVDAMNRQLELASSATYRYARDQDGRLTEVPHHTWW